MMVRLLPAVERRVAPLFRPMEKASVSTLADYTDQELLLLLDFFRRASEAATIALTELRDQGKPSSGARGGGRATASRKKSEPAHD